MDKEEEIVVVTESESSENVAITSAERLAAFEKEKMSRRAALGRFGLLAGAAAVAALTADELTRMVGSELERRLAGNKAIEQVAKELKNAGVAFAAPPFPYLSCDSTTDGKVGNYCRQVGMYPPTSPYDPQRCNNCCDQVFSDNGRCSEAEPRDTLIAKCKEACAS
jgi:hypothetical protein